MTTSTLSLTPHGRLTVVSVPDDPPLPFELSKQLVMDSVLGSGQVLLGLGAEHVGAALPPVIAWWRDLAVRYLTALCTLPEVAEHLPGRVPSPDAGELQALAWSAPPMDGAEYLSAGVLERLWQELDSALHAELQAYPVPARRGPPPGDALAVPFVLRHGDHVLSFISTTMMFGTPLDITLSEMAVETFFPADASTADRLRAVVAGLDR